MNRKLLIILGAILLIALGAVILFLLKQSQDTRSRAAGESIKLFFSPEIVSGNINSTLTTDIMLDAKTNDISGSDITLDLDPSLQFVSFTPSNSFNSQLINQYNASTHLLRIAAVNTSSTQITGLLTLGELKVKSTTPGSPEVSITKAQVTALGISNALPTDISSKAVYTVTNNGSPVPTESTDPSNGSLSFTVLLHNIGKSGDSINENKFQFSNQNPAHPSKPITVELIGTEGSTIIRTGSIIYAPDNGNFIGNINLGSGIQKNTYQVKIKSPQYLRRSFGVHEIESGKSIIFPEATFVVGDINNDNKLNTLDYNLFLKCYPQNNTCTEEERTLSDFNDDGKVDFTDFNLFSREFGVREGE